MISDDTLRKITSGKVSANGMWVNIRDMAQELLTLREQNAELIDVCVDLALVVNVMKKYYPYMKNEHEAMEIERLLRKHTALMKQVKGE